MTVDREWQHSVAIDTVGNGVATDSYQITGDVVASGGGWAEPIDYNNDQASSTQTVPDSYGNARYPLLAVYTTYDSGYTYLHVAYAVPPGGRCRSHLFATWES